jgi:DNA-binding PadR family transcriptional regulator
LILLAEQPRHGYEIIQLIAERSGGVWQPSPGSVYPALQLLEDQGLVEAEEAEGKRTFHLTEHGRAHVESHREELEQTWAAVQHRGDDAAIELRDLLGQVEMALRQVVHVGSAAQLDAARGQLVATRQRLYRILSEDEEAPQTGEDA